MAEEFKLLSRGEHHSVSYEPGFIRRNLGKIGLIGLAVASLVVGGVAVENHFEDHRTPFTLSFTFPHCQGRQPQVMDLTLPADIKFKFGPQGSDKAVTATVRDAGQIDYEAEGVQQPHPYVGQSADTHNFVFNQDDRFAVVAHPAASADPTVQNRTNVYVQQLCS